MHPALGACTQPAIAQTAGSPSGRGGQPQGSHGLWIIPARTTPKRHRPPLGPCGKLRAPDWAAGLGTIKEPPRASSLRKILPLVVLGTTTTTTPTTAPTTTTTMARQRSAPRRPVVSRAPAPKAPTQQQQTRPATTHAAHPAQPPPPQAAPVSQGPGLFGQMASTAA